MDVDSSAPSRVLGIDKDLEMEHGATKMVSR